MDKKITVLIKKDDSLFVETENYKGEACVSAIKELFQQFLNVDNFEHTSDFYDDEVGINSEVKNKL